MEGDSKAGFSIFWADEGLDTGPILLQRSCDVEPTETVDSLYNRFLYPEGIEAMVIARGRAGRGGGRGKTIALSALRQAEAVNLIASGKAPRIPQSEEGATYDRIWKDKKLAKVDLLNLSFP